MPYAIRDNVWQDAFAKELVDLWDERKLEGRIYTAWLYSTVTGFILVQEGYKEDTIRGTWVATPYRQNKVGTYLMKHLLENQKKPIVVNVTKGAEGFYELFKFQKIGHRDDFDMDVYLWTPPGWLNQGK